MFDNANTDESVSRRSVLKTAGGIVAGSTALSGLGAGRGAATPDRAGPIRVELRERNEDYVAVEVRVPRDTVDDVELRSEVYLGATDQFVVHDDEDAVSLPEEPDRLANPVEVEHRYSGERYNGKLMYFRTEDVVGYSVPDVTLGLGLFPERTVPITQWDTCPGLWGNLPTVSEDEIVVDARLPDGVSADEIEFPDDLFLGPVDEFLVHEDEDAVSLPEDTTGLVQPVEMDFDNPHDVTMYFRTESVDFPEVDSETDTLGLGIFEERTVPEEYFDTFYPDQPIDF